MKSAQLVLFMLVVIFCSIFLSLAAMAYKVPEDAVIKVYDSSGKQIGEMSRKEYKVVKIEDRVKVLPDSAVAQPQIIHHFSEPRRTSVMLGIGIGKSGLKVADLGSSIEVEEKSAFVGSLGLCSLQAGKGLCGSLSTNKTVELNLLLPIK